MLNKVKYIDISLFLFLSCMLIFIISIFSRRMFLLETLVPLLSFFGILFFGFGLWRYYVEEKNKNKKKK